MRAFVIALFLFISFPLFAQNSVSTANESVIVLQDTLIIPGLDRTRMLRLYLPPNYHQTQKRYPVLYMHDAQNLFDRSTAFAGEWGVDELLTAMYEQDGFELIVVGIDNGQSDRIHELTAWNHPKYGKEEGRAYTNFVVNTVKPYIDKHFRTLSDRENTAMMGSSLGGLITHYALFEHPEVFSKAGILSPSYWWGNGPFEQVKEASLPRNSKLYLLMGGKEGEQMLSSFNRMVELLIASGYQDQLKHKIEATGEHREWFWNQEFEDAVRWLFQSN